MENSHNFAFWFYEKVFWVILTMILPNLKEPTTEKVVDVRKITDFVSSTMAGFVGLATTKPFPNSFLPIKRRAQKVRHFSSLLCR